MKIKIFDVIELNNGKKATILEEIDNGIYKVEIVNNNGISEGISRIDNKDIEKIIFQKK